MLLTDGFSLKTVSYWVAKSAEHGLEQSKGFTSQQHIPPKYKESSLYEPLRKVLVKKEQNYDKKDTIIY